MQDVSTSRTFGIALGVVVAIGLVVVAVLLVGDVDQPIALEALSLVFGVIGFAIGVGQYAQTRQQRRAEWLDQLAQRFYEQSNHKRIRRMLDYEEQPQLAILEGAVLDAKSDESRTLMEELVDYLNFFEHLGVLEKMGQLTRSEIEDMFGYYLGLIRRREFLRSYVNQSHESFEQLARLLQRPRNRTTHST